MYTSVRVLMQRRQTSEPSRVYNGDVLYMTLCTTYTRAAAAAAAAFGYLRIYFQKQIFSS